MLFFVYITILGHIIIFLSRKRVFVKFEKWPLKCARYAGLVLIFLAAQEKIHNMLRREWTDAQDVVVRYILTTGPSLIFVALKNELACNSLIIQVAFAWLFSSQLNTHTREVGFVPDRKEKIYFQRIF